MLAIIIAGITFVIAVLLILGLLAAIVWVVAGAPALAAIVATIVLGLVFLSGSLLFEAGTGAIARRFPRARRWVVLLTTAILSFAVFALLRPLVVDQPRTTQWWVFGIVAVAALTAGAIATGNLLIECGKALIVLPAEVRRRLS